MKIAIVGAGAMGSLFGAILSKECKNEVWLIDKYPQRVNIINKKGIYVEGVSGKYNIKVRATVYPQEVGESNIIIIFVKAYDTEEAAKQATKMMGNKTTILTLQNGLNNIENISKHIRPENTLAGITSHGATLVDVGKVTHAGKGDTVIGELNGKITKRVKDIQIVFNSSGIKTKVTKNIYKFMWKKLIANAAINPLTAITGMKNGEIIQYEELLSIMYLIVSESTMVAQKMGIDIKEEEEKRNVYNICRLTSENISSMLQDIKNKKRTEIDNINGEIIKASEKLNIDIPFNKVVSKLVSAIEKRQQEGKRC